MVISNIQIMMHAHWTNCLIKVNQAFQGFSWEFRSTECTSPQNQRKENAVKTPGTPNPCCILWKTPSQLTKAKTTTQPRIGMYQLSKCETKVENLNHILKTIPMDNDSSGDLFNESTTLKRIIWSKNDQRGLRAAFLNHYCHFGLNNCYVGEMSCTLSDVYHYQWPLVTTCPQDHILSCNNSTCLQILPNVPWGQNSLWMKTIGLEVERAIIFRYKVRGTLT